MKRKLSIVLAIALVCLSMLTLLTACHSEEKEMLNMHIWEYEDKILTSQKELVLDRTIGSEEEPIEVTWTSSNPEVIAIEQREDSYLAKITRPQSGSVDVTLTIAIGNVKKEYHVTVKAIDVAEIADNFKFSNNKKEVKENFDLPGETTYNGAKATIAWSVDSKYADYIAVSNGQCVVTRPNTDDSPKVTITATFSYDNATAVKKYDFTVLTTKEKQYRPVAVAIDDLQENHPYKLAINKQGAYLYADKTMSGFYVASVAKAASAPDYYVEKVTEGGKTGYKLYYKSGSDKMYLVGKVSDDGAHANILFDKTPVVWTYNSEHNCFTVNLKLKDAEAVDYYICVSQKYSTVQLSSLAEYAPADGVGYPAFLAELEEVTDEGSGHAGTEADPYTVAEALAAGADVAKDEYLSLTDGIYVKGIVTDAGSYSDQYGNWTDVEIKDENGPSIKIYRLYPTETQTKLCQNDTITVYAYVQNYKGTLQLASSKKTDADKPILVKRDVIGTSTIGVAQTSSNKAEVVQLSATSGKNDSTFTFKVNVQSGNRLDAVKVNGVAITADNNGLYTGTVDGNTVIKVETSDENAVVLTKAASISFADKANRTKFDAVTDKVQIWEQNSIKVTNVQGASTSPVADYANPARFYKSSDITVEYTGILKIVFNCAAADKLFKIDSGSTVKAGSKTLVAGTDYTIETDGTVVTVTFTEAVNSVSFIKIAQQAQLNSIDVYVAQA